MRNVVEELRALPKIYPGYLQIPAPLVYLAGCSNFNQFCCTLRGTIDPLRFCAFCPAELSRRQRKAALELNRWRLIKNEFPHKNTSAMWLIVPHEHIIKIERLGSSDWIDIGELFSYACTNLGVTGGGLMGRFGDPHLHAGTIEHLHFNIITPKPGTGFRPPLAKTEEEHAEDYRDHLLAFWDRLTERGGIDWLMSKKGIEETQPKLAT